MSEAPHSKCPHCEAAASWERLNDDDRAVLAWYAGGELPEPVDNADRIDAAVERLDAEGLLVDCGDHEELSRKGERVLAHGREAGQ